MKIALLYHPSMIASEQLEASLAELCAKLDKEPLVKTCEARDVPFVIDEETSMVFYAAPLQRKTVKQYLSASRELRIPYTFLSPESTTLIPKHIACPVTFLEEEAEKGQFVGAFARYCGTKTDLIRANDYGSKARQTVEKIAALLDKLGVQYEQYDAQKDSFKVYREIADKSHTADWDMLLLSASRDYGLDDILFGPPELHAVMRSAVTVMLINPRGDLYALCD